MDENAVISTIEDTIISTIEDTIISTIRNSFSKPEAKALLKPQYRRLNEQSGIDSTGFCYIAAEAVYHLYGKRFGFEPKYTRIESGTHWWLENRNTGGDLILPKIKLILLLLVPFTHLEGFLGF